MPGPLVSVRDLVVEYKLPRGRRLRAVDGVSLDIGPGEILGLVGESGCGKSTLGRAIVRLNRPAAGQILFRGTDLVRLSDRELRPFRRLVQMIFQDARASLDPRMTIGASIGEPLQVLRIARGVAAGRRVEEVMELTGLDPALCNRYPHELSGGQRQRAGIARAIAAEPELIVADEPVSSLDVSIQAQILNLLRDLHHRLGLALLFISHDLRAVEYVADRIAVMYLGQIVEVAPAASVVRRPLAPYTRALVSAVPVADPAVEKGRGRIVLKGEPASALHPPAGCRFHPRCPYASAQCRLTRPELEELQPGHFAACIRISIEQPDIDRLAAQKNSIS